MRLLLDTHIALWAVADTTKISDKLIEAIENPENEVYYSIVSIWEIAIKHAINPKNMPISEEEFVKLCEEAKFKCLEISPEHIFAIKTLSRDKKEKR